MQLHPHFLRSSPVKAGSPTDSCENEPVGSRSRLPQRLREIFEPDRAAKRLLTAWLICCCTLVAWLRDFLSQAFAEDVPLWQIAGFSAVLFLLLSLAALKLPAHWENRLLAAVVIVFAFLLTHRYSASDILYFYLALLAALALILFPLWRQPPLENSRLTFGRRSRNAAILLCGLFFAAAVGTLTCLRYITYQTPNYDFGIFCNMFYHMKTSLLPLTTCERDTLLSHFAVHISPIYYLLLPFYAIFPSPLTLQIGQAAVLASSLIPLCLLAKKYGLSDSETVLLSLAAACYPALSGGCSFDIHENCFLPPLLLWMFVCYEYRRPILLYIAAFAVLMVKEDAAAYVLIFAAFLFFSRKERRHSLLLADLSLGYFVFALHLLNTFGEGAMTGHYPNLIGEDGSFLDIPLLLLRNPGYFLSQLFLTVTGDDGKFQYLLQLFAPLALLPLCTRKFDRFLLLAPLLLNLLTTYVYQYDITFQYSFGITAFLFYLALMNAADRPPAKRQFPLRFAAVAACLLFTMITLPAFRGLLYYLENEGDSYKQMDAILDTIPADASVTASTMLVAHLADRDSIYDLSYHTEPDTDFLILDIRSGYQWEAEEQALAYREAGYQTLERYENLVEILQKPV